MLSQLESIERNASSIIFFNEPLTNLDELHWPFTFPHDALQPLAPSDQLPLGSNRRCVCKMYMGQNTDKTGYDRIGCGRIRCDKLRWVGLS